ncbi:MAG TPA: AAA family ATPase [Steroidobacteraceae bacterium]|jgi:predicted ATPase/DNA-binding CsgD family transcriptional regulator|nr:AAA family ATPase [Steroidobacteraceae bacterium]
MHLLEREIYLDALSSGFAGLAEGRGCIALVSGEAGIGKTALIQEFTAERRKAARVYWGGCEALFTPHPLAPLHDIARQAGGELPAIIAAATNRDLIFHATINHLAQGLKATIVVFEDVHWADEATLDLIKFLGRRMQHLPVMLIISYRDDEVGMHHPLRSVIGDLPVALLKRLSLPSLSESAVQTMALRVGREATDLCKVTGGNPFFVTEALAVADHEVPATVRDAVLARISRLSESARRVANLAALAPGKLERWLLDAIVAPDACDVEECLAAGMVARDNSIAFRHELARHAVEESLATPVRQHLHARILAALQAQAPAEMQTARLVHHADRAGDSAAVLRFAPLAADEALNLCAHRQVAAHLATALGHAAALGSEEKALLLDRLSYECYLTGQITEAVCATESSLALWKAAGNRYKEGDCLRWLSRLTWFTANKAAADRYAAMAVAILEPLAPGRELAMAYSNLSQLHMLADEPEGALIAGEKALALARTLGDSEIESHALNNVGTSKLAAQNSSGIADLERSLALALAGGFQEHAARAYGNMATSAARARDFDRARRYFSQGIAYCEERDLYAWVRYMTASRAETLLAQGEWEAAAEAAELIGQDAKIAAVARIPALVALARVRLRRGDPGVSKCLDEAAELAFASGEVQRIAPVVAARAEAAWIEGTLVDSLDEITRGYKMTCKISDSWMQGELAFWLWRAGRLQEPTEQIARPWALQIAGEWQGAAAAWEAIGCPYERALALAECKSDGAVRTALQIFEGLGAAPMAAITRRKLRERGVRNIPRGIHERTKQNPHQLTRRQLQVLGLLAEGCRNAEIAGRLFLSEKTIDHHVSAVLEKLQVRSRGEAAAVANRLGLGVSGKPIEATKR